MTLRSWLVLIGFALLAVPATAQTNSPAEDISGRAEILSQDAARLFAAGENQNALDTYQRARKLFEQVGDRRGQGNTFKGEADVLFVMGASKKAIDGYKRARELFEQVGDRRGQGSALNGCLLYTSPSPRDS